MSNVVPAGLLITAPDATYKIPPLHAIVPGFVSVRLYNVFVPPPLIVSGDAVTCRLPLPWIVPPVQFNCCIVTAPVPSIVPPARLTVPSVVVLLNIRLPVTVVVPAKVTGPLNVVLEPNCTVPA